VNAVLTRWNSLKHDEAAEDILPCCGSRAWAKAIAVRRPFQTGASLLEASVEIWRGLNPADRLEAFQSHPRIGESRTARPVSPKSQEWSSLEQQKVADADAAVKVALSEGNRLYEQRFGRIFIVCATGKSSGEILTNLRRRLQNDDAVELCETVAEQEQIMQIRLKKWLGE
jgi:2-oxo-4-hydroxy-4-carboxy-5-ureidoimidazoline decarboxylase